MAARRRRRSRKSDASDAKVAFSIAGIIAALIFWNAASWELIVCLGVCLVVLAALVVSAVTWWCNLGAKQAQPAPVRAARPAARRSGRSQRNHAAEGVMWSSDFDPDDPNSGLDWWRYAYRPHNWTRRREPKTYGPI
jgi:hypothetical protein